MIFALFWMSASGSNNYFTAQLAQGFFHFFIFGFWDICIVDDQQSTGRELAEKMLMMLGTSFLGKIQFITKDPLSGEGFVPVFVEWKIYGGIRWVLGSICQSKLTLADAIITPEIDYIILLQQLMQLLEFFFSAPKVLAGFGDSRTVDVIYTEEAVRT